MWRAVVAQPKATTSTGNGNVEPNTGTRFVWSTTIARSRAAWATIFSFRSAPPPPLNKVQVGVDLVGSVNGPRVLRLQERNAVCSRELCSVVGGGDADDAQAVFDALPQAQDHVARRGPGPESDDIAMADIVQGAQGRSTLELVEIGRD